MADRQELATRAWTRMQELVLGHDPKAELRDALGLGRGAGRVRLLLSLGAGPLSVGEIAEMNAIDAPYATLIVNELAARGLVSRTGDPGDRRRKLVELTSDGVAAADTARTIISRPPPALFDSLADPELANLSELLGQLGPGDR